MESSKIYETTGSKKTEASPVKPIIKNKSMEGSPHGEKKASCV
jgi:hypothetical protein